MGLADKLSAAAMNASFHMAPSIAPGRGSRCPIL
jgi:hypothetical protein